MRQNAALLLGVLLTIMMTSCVSQYPTIVLSPHRENGIWIDGKEYLQKTNAGILAQVSFDHAERDAIVFNVKITNKTRRDILVDPTRCYYVALNNLPDEIIAKGIVVDGGAVTATDPEQLLDGINQKMADENSSYKQDQLVSAGAGCMGAAASVSDNTQTRHDGSHLMNDATDDMHSRENLHRQRMAAYKEEQLALGKTLLRKNTLAPQKIIEGKLFFPYVDAGFFQLVIVADDKRMVYHFMRSIIKPNNREDPF